MCITEEEERLLQGEGVTDDDIKLLPGVEEGRPLPAVKEEDRLLPGAEDEGRLLPGAEEEGRLLPGAEEEGRLLPCLTCPFIRSRKVLLGTSYKVAACSTLMPLFTASRALTIFSSDHCFLRTLLCVRIVGGADTDRLFSVLRLRGIV